MRATLFLLFVALPLHAQSDLSVISLGLGQQKVIQVANVARVAIGEPGVADVKQVGGAGNELLITGVGEGRTSMLVWHNNNSRQSYVVVVRKQDPREVVSEVRALLGDREGVQVRTVGDRVYLDGETLTAGDYERVQQVVQLYPSVKSFVRPSGNARKLSAESLNRAYQKNELKGVTAYVVGSSIFLEGWVDSLDDLKKLELITRSFGEKAESLVTVGQKKLVLVEVDFVEVATGANKLVGVKPPAQILSTGGGATATVSIVQPIPGLDTGGTLKSGALTVGATAGSDFSVGARFDNSYQRILSQPKLLAASGEKAEFLAGGELPILAITQNTFNVEYKKFGVLLSVTPTADRSGNIGTEIYAEISTVDRTVSAVANGVNVPGFKVRNVKTSVSVHDGDTIVLSGLYNYSEDKEVSKLPLLGNIPILGELFKSRNFIDNKTELAIYITPRVVTPGHEQVEKIIQDSRDRYKEAGKSVSFSIFD
ncbi:MAG TPA: pilus assembly protein N-terminal domain-containing protein [Myxococcales bacterium]|nr:pilus assembly protein N-terminal domain-containing protein [Myxococcales bacterium]